MKNFKKNIEILLIVVGALLASALFSIATYALLSTTFDGVKALVLDGEVKTAKLTLVFVVSMVAAAINYVRLTTIERRRFIAIVDTHQIVEPANRRDELIDA